MISWGVDMERKSTASARRLCGEGDEGTLNLEE